VARVDAIPAQCPLTDGRWAAADTANEILHAVIRDRLAREESPCPSDERIAQSLHVHPSSLDAYGFLSVPVYLNHFFEASEPSYRAG
jgi:hypothetical protein